MHEMCRKQKYKVETQDITWKTHNDGKNHDNPRAAEYTIREEYNDEENTQRQRPFVFFFTTRGGGYKMEATTSLSLSHTLYNFFTTFNTIESICPKSYLYIYDFRVIYINVHRNRSDRSEPVLRSAGSLYLLSGGTCFPTTSC